MIVKRYCFDLILSRFFLIEIIQVVYRITKADY